MLCAIDNVVVQYTCERLRLISISDVLPNKISCLAADKRYVYAAAGKSIAVLHLSRYHDHLICLFSSWFTCIDTAIACIGCT